MKNLFDKAAVAETKQRIARLGPGNQRQWGNMDLPQALAHSSIGFELALGELRPPRELLGRLLGWAIKPLALGNDAPMRPGSPTAKSMVVADRRELDAERARLLAMMDRFVAGGPAACSTHPHPFFGRLTPEQWAILMYKHVDHHLRQFGG